MGFDRNNTKLHEPLPEIKKSNLLIDPSFVDLEDSFLDSLLNFEGWLEDTTTTTLVEDMNSEEKANLGLVESKIKEEEEVYGFEKLAVLDSFVEEGMGRVGLTSAAGDDDYEKGIQHDSKQETRNSENVSEGVKIDDENQAKNDAEKGDDDDGDGESEDSEDESSSSSSSSSSASSSSSDEEDDEKPLKEKGEVEMEEGEIREEMLDCSDDEDVDIVKGPIRSRNEVQDLPPVPPVTVTIQPHHQTLPVGAVLSIMGSQVVVEGVEKHNPLSEGSILWITKTRSPLGVVDEIFGPVKNPYYIVRYNSEAEIPTGIQQGSSISFVPEFADYVLNNNNLYKKGYDASGENDEELSEELEFSDDEKEAEYKRMLKMSKRGSSGDKNGGTKKDKKSRNRGGNRKNDHQPLANLQVNSSSGPPSGPSNGPPNGPASGPVNGPRSFQQAPNITPPRVQPFGFPAFQPQNIGFPPNAFPPNAFPPFMQPNFIQQPFQNLAGPNLAPFDPRFNTTSGPMFSCNFIQGVPPNPPNFGAFPSWASGIPQNNCNQPQAGPPMVFQQGVAGPNNSAGNGEASQSGGRRQFQRGGGRFRGGRNGPRSR